MRRLIRKRLLDKVRNAAIEKNPANANNKKQGKQQSKRNEKEVPNVVLQTTSKVRRWQAQARWIEGSQKETMTLKGHQKATKRMLRRTTRIVKIMKKRRKRTLRQRTKTNMRVGGWRRFWTEQLWIQALTKRRRRTTRTTTL
jgi:hypothetical protein